MTPSNLTQFLLIIAFVVPGIVYQTVRARYMGEVPQNSELAAKVLRALAASTMLALIYVVVFSHRVADILAATPTEAATYAQLHAGQCARWTFALVFAVPALLGRLVAIWPATRFRGVRLLDRAAGAVASETRIKGWTETLLARTSNPTGLKFDTSPSTWDWAVDHGAGGDGFVRVCDADGQWWGGAFGKDSFFSTYPQDPAIYVETAWTLSASGEFVTQQDGTRGAWIQCKDARAVQFLRASDEDSVTEPTTGDDDG